MLCKCVLELPNLVAEVPRLLHESYRMLSGLDLLLFASWLHTDGASLGTGKSTALDAMILLSHPLSYQCHGMGRTRGGEGVGLD